MPLEIDQKEWRYKVHTYITHCWRLALRLLFTTTATVVVGCHVANGTSLPVLGHCFERARDVCNGYLYYITRTNYKNPVHKRPHKVHSSK